MFNKSLVAAALLAASQITLAQENEDATNYDYDGWSVDIQASLVSLDSKAALSEGIDESAYAISGSFVHRSSSWISAATLDLIFYDDNESFQQIVVGQGFLNNGDVSVESSDATASALSLSTGYEWRTGDTQNIALTAMAGYTLMINSERTIELCDNCTSVDIDIDGGIYTSVSASVELSSFELGVFARQYLSGDISNMFGIKAEFRF